MYALTYTKLGNTKPSKIMLRMDDRQQELYRLVESWVSRDLGNRKQKLEEGIRLAYEDFLNNPVRAER